MPLPIDMADAMKYIFVGWDTAAGKDEAFIVTSKTRKDTDMTKPRPDFDAMADTLAEAVFQHIEGQRAMVKGELALTLKKELMVLLDEPEQLPVKIKALKIGEMPERFLPQEYQDAATDIQRRLLEACGVEEFIMDPLCLDKTTAVEAKGRAGWDRLLRLNRNQKSNA